MTLSSEMRSNPSFWSHLVSLFFNKDANVQNKNASFSIQQCVWCTFMSHPSSVVELHRPKAVLFAALGGDDRSLLDGSGDGMHKLVVFSGYIHPFKNHLKSQIKLYQTQHLIQSSKGSNLNDHDAPAASLKSYGAFHSPT